MRIIPRYTVPAPYFTDIEPKELFEEYHPIKDIEIDEYCYEQIPDGATHFAANSDQPGSLYNYRLCFYKRIFTKNINYPKQLEFYNKNKAKFEKNLKKWEKDKAEFEDNYEIIEKEKRRKEYIKLKKEFES